MATESDGTIGLFHHRGWHYALMTAIAGVVFFLHLGGATLWDRDEGRNAECSLEMLESGNWIVPTFNGKLRVDKPVLLYWLQVFSYQRFGVNEWSARFPSAMAALLTVFLCYELARSMFSRTTGLLAGVIAATTPMLCGAARFANPDSLLNTCTALTLTFFWLGRETRRSWWFAALGAALGLGTLAKGPVGLVLPSAVVFLFCLWNRQLRIYLDGRWLWACLTFAVVAIPWYVWVGLETHGEYLRGFIWTHNLERGLSAMEHHGGFPGFYLVVLLGGTMPWSIFLLLSWWYGLWSAVRQPWSLWQGWWSHAAEGGSPNEAGRAGYLDTPAAYRLLACWVFVYLCFFSVAATKLPNYVLPTVVPCAILIARFLQRWQTGGLQLPAVWAYSAVLGLGVIGAIMVGATAVASGIIEVPKMQGRTIVELQPWTLLGLAPLAAAAAGWWFLRRRQYSWCIATVAVVAIVLLGPFAAYASVIFNRYKAPQPLVEEADALRPHEDIRVGCLRLDNLPSINFYVRRDVTHLSEDPEVPRFLAAPVPVYLFIQLDDWQRLTPDQRSTGRIVARHRDMYSHNDVLVVTNR